jgi:hypothetical protein
MESARPEAFYNLGVLYKDFRANETENQKAAQGAYRTAIKYFTQARGKPNAKPALQAEAKQNVEDCEKAIKQIDDFLRTAPPAAAKK